MTDIVTYDMSSVIALDPLEWYIGKTALAILPAVVAFPKALNSKQERAARK